MKQPIFRTQSGTDYFFDPASGLFYRAGSNEGIVLLGSIDPSRFDCGDFTPAPHVIRGRGALQLVEGATLVGFVPEFREENYAFGFVCNPAEVAAVGVDEIYLRDVLRKDETRIFDARVTTPLESVIRQPT